MPPVGNLCTDDEPHRAPPPAALEFAAPSGADSAAELEREQRVQRPEVMCCEVLRLTPSSLRPQLEAGAILAEAALHFRAQGQGSRICINQEAHS